MTFVKDPSWRSLSFVAAVCPYNGCTGDTNDCSSHESYIIIFAESSHLSLSECLTKPQEPKSSHQSWPFLNLRIVYRKATHN